jgi:long-subunit acyl-CoA synthetase (AMP-forming)
MQSSHPIRFQNGIAFFRYAIFLNAWWYICTIRKESDLFFRTLDNVVADINDVKPMSSPVPRVLEKVYDKIIEKGKP